ncbi:hypothetical protein AURDEDRAFT_166664 [Auricularia subglabra TFB-10046 SS5]|nr:hypothetical protein AURDEDRAFT_166664 [Auricularia subglabra TFB-10046 SS5]
MKPALLLAIAAPASASIIAYGICQTGCNIGAVACYAAAGATFGTVVAAPLTPAAILACNAALGTHPSFGSLPSVTAACEPMFRSTTSPENSIVRAAGQVSDVITSLDSFLPVGGASRRVCAPLALLLALLLLHRPSSLLRSSPAIEGHLRLRATGRAWTRLGRLSAYLAHLALPLHDAAISDVSGPDLDAGPAPHSQFTLVPTFCLQLAPSTRAH